MGISTGKGRNGMDCVQIRNAHGDAAEVYLNGGHVTSWVVDGDEKLFLGSRAAFAKGESIRGGIPVVFPQFADQGPLPAHGFARTSQWSLGSSDDSENGVSVTLRLDDNAETRKLWPWNFELDLTVTLNVRTLRVELTVRNTGAGSFDFTAALHTYLRVSDINTARVTGLRGCRYLDKTRGKQEMTDGSSGLAIREETDRVYLDAPASLMLRDAQRSPLRVESRGFRDAVVWNPWRDKVKTFSGMAEDDYRRMICVEAAQVGDPVVLNAAESWSGSQTLTVGAE